MSGAARYEVWVNAIVNGHESINEPVLRGSNITGTSWTPKDGQALSPGQSYRRYVGAVSTNGTVFWSEGMTFSIDALAAPVAVGPEGSTASDTPTFTWNAVAGATHYDLWVNAIVNGHETINHPVLRNTNVTDSSKDSGKPYWTPSAAQALSPGQSYRWYVGAISNNGTTFWSSGMDFSIDPLPAPVPSSPSGPGDDDTPTFTWNPIAGADHYDVWINTIIDGHESINDPVLRNANSASTSWTPSTALTRDRTYIWYVGTVSTNGTIFWSQGLEFTITA